MAKLFGWQVDDKDIVMDGPDDLSIRIDYDDVDHSSIRRAVRKMATILNSHWNDPVVARAKRGSGQTTDTEGEG